MKLDVRSVAAAPDATKVPFPQVKQEFRILLAEEAFDAIVSHGATDLGREVGGVLVGELLADAGGPYVRINATIEAVHADEKGAELTFTHATWEHVNKEMDSRFANQRILGWYHTHPGFGIFLSDRDRFIHSSFFGEPYQIAFVYNPKKREHGVFAWREGKPRRWRRYAVGDREHSFDGTIEEKEGKPAEASDEKQPAASSAAETAVAASEDEGRPDSRGSVLFTATIALLFLLGGGALGWFFASRGTEAVLLQQRELFMQSQAKLTRQTIGMVGDQLVGVLRAATGESVLSKGIDGIGNELDRALAALDKAAEKNASADTRSQAHQALTDARAMGTQLKANWSNAQVLLGRLDEAARALGNPGNAGKEMGRQRALIGQLFAELAEQAAHDKDTQRATRLFLTAADAQPDGRERYHRRMQELGLAPAPPPAKPAPPQSSEPRGQ